MESPGEWYSLPVFGFCSPSEVKSELDIFSGELESSSPQWSRQNVNAL
jgi:hypothetical protein